jgi:replicative DNA helicase
MTTGTPPSSGGSGTRTPHEVQLPWDEHAERAVLGSVLLDNAALDAATQTLIPSDFYRPAHADIFQAYVNLAQRREVVDPYTVRAELERMGKLDGVGGIAGLAELIDGLPRSENVKAYAKLIHDHSLRRQLYAVADQTRDNALTSRDTVDEIVNEAEQSIFELSQKGHLRGFERISTIGERSIDRLEELSNRRELVTGTATGLTRLDEMTSGFQPGDLIILAARPSMGKTALALNIAEHVGLQGGSTVGVFSLEMSGEQLFYRMLSCVGRINSHKIRTGRLSDQEWDLVNDSYDRLVEAPIFIDDTSDATPMEIRSKARKLKSEHDLGLIVVDYLQLMRADKGSDSRQQEISSISRAMKGVAKDLEVPVLALSQLSRAPDQRQGDHRPQLSDLRESGAIEQDADVVLFIFRPEVYERDPEKIAEKELEGKAEVIVAKQRNGPTGMVPLYFIKQYTRFETRDDSYAF